MASDEVKQFLFGLEQCRPQKGMIWYGDIPAEICDMFGIERSPYSHGYKVAGIYVTEKPRYEAFTPDWLKEETDG